MLGCVEGSEYSEAVAVAALGMLYPQKQWHNDYDVKDNCVIDIIEFKFLHFRRNKKRSLLNRYSLGLLAWLAKMWSEQCLTV